MTECGADCKNHSGLCVKQCQMCTEHLKLNKTHLCPKRIQIP